MHASPTSTRLVAPVMEVFASIQGEGAYVGEPQAFVRLRGCPLRCRWCDTPQSWKITPHDRARIARPEPATRAEEPVSIGREEPWATPFQVACWVAAVEPGAPRTVSVTGGEPLLWPDFLLGLKAMLGGRRVHLETAGAHPRTLARVIDAFDHISLDLKPEQDLDDPEDFRAAEFELEGSILASEPSPRSKAEWKIARRDCLALVRGRDACGKIVVSGERSALDLARLLDEVECHAPELPVYLQPATPVKGLRAPARETLESLAEMARDRGLAVRVLPQIHRALRMP